ncbi:MAG: hypothetical protein ACJAYU_003722 [Bradymonadia bacterium]|jgi:hypothetical protein
MAADSASLLMMIGILPAYCVGFSLLWCGVVFITAALSGWRNLGERFQTAAEPPGGAQTVGARLGWANYTHAMRLGWDHEGYLHMSVLGIFKVGHPNLRIPAEAIQEERKSGLLGQRVLLDLGGITTLTVRAAAWDELRG